MRVANTIRSTVTLPVIGIAMVATSAPARATDAADLARQVEIRRTAYGVPHIHAETLEAAAFGLGYCQAEDHLENIMRSMLRARGELAVHFGGEDNVASDFWNRQFQVHERAVATYDQLDADFRSMLEGFAAGLNEYVDRHRDRVPSWIPTVTGRDVAAHGLTGVMRFAFNRGRIIEGFLRSHDVDVAYSPAMQDDDLHGSNMWAFAPSRSQSGHAMLMGNPHQPWSQVATYYEAHLTVPGVLNFYGSTFVGRPVLTTGWNENLGWSHTVNYPDLEEIYELHLDPKRPQHYLFDGKSVPLTMSTARVDVKTDDGVETRERDFWYSPLGPVIHRDAEHVYVIKSAVYDEFRFYQQWLRMAQSRNFDEFRAALAIHAIPMFNICYADREGNIYYLWNGTVPDLPHPRQTSTAVPAAGAADVWTRFHPLDELPQLLNPPGGYVHNCNSPPYFTNLHEPLRRDRFSAHFPDNNVSLRSQHSLLLIDNDRKLSLEDVRDLKHSMGMVLADRVKDDLIAALEAAGTSPETDGAIGVLKDWDNTVAVDSRGSVLFDVWWSKYAKRTGEENFAVAWSESAPVSTPHGLADPQRAVTAFREAVEEVRTDFGRLDVAWGEVHRIRRGTSVDLAMGGGSGLMGCFRVAGFDRDDDRKWRVSGGDSWVFAVEFGDTPRGFSIVGYSQSEIEGTPHFADQAPLYSAGTLKPVAFTEAEIAEQLLTTYHPGEE